MDTYDLQNMMMLYSESDSEVYQALLNKKDWINNVYYVKGHLDTKEDSRKRIHYLFIEALLDDVLLFRLLNKNDVHDYRLDIWNEQYRILDLYEKRPHDCPFAVAYDFSNLDRQAYNMLMPNFYFGHNINTIDDGQTTITSLLKILLRKNHPFILLEESNLLDDVFYAPILKEIIINPQCDKILQEELISIAQEKNITITYNS